MTRTVSLVWGSAVVCVALLNMADILPDGATILAILTLPALAVRRSRKGLC